MRIRSQTAIGLWPYGPKGHSHTAVWPLWPCAHTLQRAICGSCHGLALWLHLRMRMGAVLPCAYAAKLPSAYGPMALRATATPQFGHCGLALIRCSRPCGSRHGLALWLHLRMRMGAVLPCAYACRLGNFNLNCKQFYLQGPTLLKNTMPCSSVRIYMPTNTAHCTALTTWPCNTYNTCGS